ncbi:MAG: patatin [Frankiales bacterium]|nr:patatin [Frankiales bacterium]
MSTALVLAGGGVAGIAWETGVLLGLRDEGVDLTRPDLLVGTSAGSTVGAQLLSGTDLEELHARQLSPDHQELTPEMDLARLIEFFTGLGDISGGVTPVQLRELGSFALSAQTVDVSARQAVIRWRLPSHEWPAAPLKIPTVDARTGELVVLDRDSGVSLVDAVCASCAVPGVWPVVPLLGRDLMDGGTRSIANADLAAGYDDVLILLPLAQASPVVDTEAAALRASGARVTVLTSDEASIDAMGPNPLDPSRRPPVAEAARRQGRALAASISR